MQAGSRGRKRWGGQPVTSMDLRASASLRDDDIISLLATIDTLEYSPLTPPLPSSVC